MSNEASEAAYRTHAGLDGENADAELEPDPIIAVTGEDIPANEKAPYGDSEVVEDENLTQLGEVEAPGTQLELEPAPGTPEGSGDPEIAD